MTREDALRKAAALLRLAARPGTPGEAAAATARAQSIMDEYEISHAAALDAGEERAEPDEPIEDFDRRAGGEVDSMRRRQAWRFALAGAVARANGCYIYRGRRGEGVSIEIVGRPSHVESVRYLYGWLAREVARLADEQGRGMGSVWRREFCEGAASELANRLHEQRKATEDRIRAEAASPGALVHVNRAIVQVEQRRAEVQAWVKENLKLVKGRAGSNRQYDETAREAGRRAAQGIDLGNRSRRRLAAEGAGG